MKQVPTASFSEFIDYFPLLKPPINLLPDLRQIPSDPVPLPAVLQETYILPFEGDETDEFTEYVPYGRIEGPKDFYAIIYWKAGVLRYEFILATFSLKGHPMSHAIVGGLRFEEEGTIHSVAVIHEDLRITIAEGMSRNESPAEGSSTQTYSMIIQTDGQISYDGE